MKTKLRPKNLANTRLISKINDYFNRFPMLQNLLMVSLVIILSGCGANKPLSYYSSDEYKRKIYKETAIKNNKMFSKKGIDSSTLLSGENLRNESINTLPKEVAAKYLNSNLISSEEMSDKASNWYVKRKEGYGHRNCTFLDKKVSINTMKVANGKVTDIGKIPIKNEHLAYTVSISSNRASIILKTLLSDYANPTDVVTYSATCVLTLGAKNKLNKVITSMYSLGLDEHDGVNGKVRLNYNKDAYIDALLRKNK